VLDVDGQHFSTLMKMNLTLAVPLCLVQLEQHLLALFLFVPSNCARCGVGYSPMVTMIYELLLLTYSLWPLGVLMSYSENFCE
jgi:hypothetical protein